MISFHSCGRIWFLTWTTYGTWLPGDERGFVSNKFEGAVTENRNNAPGTQYDLGRPVLKWLSKRNQHGASIWLKTVHAEGLQTQFEETAGFRGWTILAGAVMPNHVHLVVGVSGDPHPGVLLRDFKSYGRRVLNRKFERPENGSWWSEHGSKRKVKDQHHLDNVIQYVQDQPNSLVVWKLELVDHP